MIKRAGDQTTRQDPSPGGVGWCWCRATGSSGGLWRRLGARGPGSSDGLTSHLGRPGRAAAADHSTSTSTMGARASSAAGGPAWPPPPGRGPSGNPLPPVHAAWPSGGAACYYILHDAINDACCHIWGHWGRRMMAMGHGAAGRI
jgi:hypothetical protein